MTMFGRDSIFTSLQALPFAPELAATTLRALGAWQGSGLDDFRDEDPGRILHEMRYGEMTAFEERPHSPYYGCADATPLYVVLLDEYERWTGDRSSSGISSTRRGRRSTGSTSTPTCWAPGTSGTSAATRRPASRTSAGRTPGTRSPTETAGCPASRGRPASSRGTPTTRRCAVPAWRALVWKDPEFADRLEQEAADLKRRFNRDFWVEDGEFFALALDTEGKQVDALASNNGHLLWSGIVDKSKAKAVARQLMGPKLFSGWGVRTLAEGEARYNPIGYHVGTVWPFDNSFIAWGLRRYGFKEEAAQLAAGILDAAEFFDGRLPEAFGGYPRSRRSIRCSTRRRAARRPGRPGTPMLLLRAMLGLEPEGEHLVIDPALPRHIGRLELLDIPGRWGRIDAFGRGRVDVDDASLARGRSVAREDGRCEAGGVHDAEAKRGETPRSTPIGLVNERGGHMSATAAAPQSTVPRETSLRSRPTSSSSSGSRATSRG